MLGGLALKWRWRERRRAAGRPADRPNLVMGANVQVCWEKFCRYFDVEARLVPVEKGRHHLTARTAVEQCDERTIGVVAILGSTFDGSYEPVAEIAAALDALAAGGGPDVPIHVDGAVRAPDAGRASSRVRVHVARRRPQLFGLRRLTDVARARVARTGIPLSTRSGGSPRTAHRRAQRLQP
jgi:hypothetical protein